MAFQPRHRWLIQLITAAFSFHDEVEVENLIHKGDLMDKISNFFSIDGPTVIFFYYQRINNSSLNSHSDNTNDNTLQDNPVLFITNGKSESLEGKCLYVMKTYSSESNNNNNHISIDLSIFNDGLLSYGIIDESCLESLETLLSKFYLPHFQSRSLNDWGKAEKETSIEFLSSLKKCVDDLHESLKSMNSGLELRKPDIIYDSQDPRNINRFSTDEIAISHFTELLTGWSQQTEAYLDENDQLRWEPTDAGPETELEYWKRRIQRLTGITEQLKSRECRLVIGVLTTVTKQQQHQHQQQQQQQQENSNNIIINRQNIISLLKKWKQIDISITEAANEAKDNVKYLVTLEKFLEPLYNGTITTVIDSLPALMNSIKMIHTIARYYNTTERMTKLFMKITNQMISLCKKTILVNGNQEFIWERNSIELIESLESCLQLNESYQEQYRLTKDKLLTMPKGKQFDFSEAQIFGKFDLFSRRIIKLIDMFNTIQQFKSLADYSLEGMEDLVKTFKGIINEFKGNKHDLLDYHNNKFDRDYVEFNVKISDLEVSLQQFINQSFDNITSIEQSLSLLKQFQTILQRENLRSDLDSKFTIIFHNYGLDLTAVQDIYEKYRHNPPTMRNMSPVACNIMWSRHLLKRIEEPMKKFESNPSVLATKDSKKIIKTYNKVARTLVAYEYLWIEAWCKSIEISKSGLQATLIIKHPETGQFYVNFDKEILKLIREAKALDRMGIEIPENAKLIMLQEDKFKNYYNDLTYLLKEYDRVMSKVIPITQKLLEPHIADLQHKIKPGMITLTWTSMNIDAYKLHVHNGLQKLEELLTNINDMLENRIEKNLKVISNAVLVNLPTTQSFALDDFVRMQEKHVHSVTTILSAKNIEIENAVEDVIHLMKTYIIDCPSIKPVDDIISDTLRQHYKNIMYRAILNCTKQSLNSIKTRICSKTGTGFLFIERPFFEVDVQLSVPSVRLSPSLEDVQQAINRSAVAVLRCSKNLYTWRQYYNKQQQIQNQNQPIQNQTIQNQPIQNQTIQNQTIQNQPIQNQTIQNQPIQNQTIQNQPIQNQIQTTFFDKLGCDTEIIKVAILLTGALHGTKNHVNDYLSTFKKYDWLWKEDMEFRYNQFMKRNPTIEDFENELKGLMQVEAEINQIASVHNIAALSLNTKNLKLQLRNECRQWKVQYSDRVHQEAKDALYRLIEYIRLTNIKLNRSVDSLDSLRFVMGVLKEVREKESSIEMEINPIIDMYQMLENYLPGGYMDKEEMDQKSLIRNSWRKLVEYAEEVTDALSDVQGIFKKQLIIDIKDFQLDIIQFRNDFLINGPMLSGLKPFEAVERLNRYKDQLLLRERKLDAYSAGEELFGMRKTEYPEIIKTRKEIYLLDQLYGLYMDVINTIENYKNILYSNLSNELNMIIETINLFDQRCKKMPKNLCEWEAYRLLRKEICNFLDILPLLVELSKEYIKTRHWKEIMKITEIQFSFDEEKENNFKLKTILDMNLLRYKEEIEEICESANKQLQIEIKLKDIKEFWSTKVFEFITWSSREVPILKGFGDIIANLEDAQLQMQTMLSMRHITPFKEEIQLKLSQISETADTLERWIKVQTLWMSLESVFTGGDIAKQMPLEAKKFAKIDKDWIKIMLKASETLIVLNCCSNELLKSTLPLLFNELEKCQKSLEGYLEQKRTNFPRFYFVSNSVLLQILSHGSDPLSIQLYYEKLFDSIDNVIHDKLDKRIITSIRSISGLDEEIIPFLKPVIAEGNIEDWLSKLEKEMQRTMKSICKHAAEDCFNLSLLTFINKYCGQFALLGLQFNWTFISQEALEKVNEIKTSLIDCLKRQTNILTELSSFCLTTTTTEFKSQLNRCKLETLITIQVHQRDVFSELVRLYKERKLSSSLDFEWLKQTRFYYKTGNNISDLHGLDACIISICDVDFKYSFEYLGCKERLVITPLTDRAYITLSQSLHMSLGGAPAGPAGTGKTETVKDLGRTLGIYVVVTNCTDQQRYTDMAKIFKGICQGGLWACFDEFNRINLRVLSVVAQQVLAITNAKRMNINNFIFPGDLQSIHLNTNVGYFITMNPGYKGRQELPENLKALFRGVSMMVPDREIIIKVKLCSVGYIHFNDLARKFKVLYSLCEEQLSKQKHYDFGLRNILSVLRTAGKTKRNHMNIDEEYLLMITLRDMNLSKLIAQDTPLFLSLLNDLFPLVTTTTTTKSSSSSSSSSTILTEKYNPQMEQELSTVLKHFNLIPHPSWIQKVYQFYETCLVRHGIMLIGPSGSGKSTVIKVLQTILSSITKISHKQNRINPKAIRCEEMFGETDRITGEWLDGIFASMWSKLNDRNRKDINWIICDGPVDAIWIENLNTVLDDNKILTLANGDRIPMTDNVKLMFEVENLNNASPATVSRTGIIYISTIDLDWQPIVEGWILTCSENRISFLTILFEKYFGKFKSLEFIPNITTTTTTTTSSSSNTINKNKNIFNYLKKHCETVIECSKVALIESFLHLFNGLIKNSNISESESDAEGEIERLFIYSLTWSLGSLCDLEGRIKFHKWLCDSCSNLPLDLTITPTTTTANTTTTTTTTKDTIFDYCINLETLEWEKWIIPHWDYPLNGSNDFSNLIVPTIDTIRTLSLIENLQNQNIPVLLLGSDGIGKTTIIQLYLNKLNTNEMSIKKINFSHFTTPGMFQRTIEGELDKRGGKNFGPINGKKLTLFLDDIGMPEKNEWNDQPTLELIRQLIETGGICFLDKDKRGDFKAIEDLFYLGAMNYPKNGKNDIPNRLKRHFFLLNLLIPTNETIESIFHPMLRGHFPANFFKKNFLDLLSRLPLLTIDLWIWIKKTMLPTPAKFHYLFNLRDLSRIFQGILRVSYETINEKILMRLWYHECERVFSDKLINFEDKTKFKLQIDTLIDVIYGKVLNKEKLDSSLFVDFLKEDIYDQDGILIQSAIKCYEYGGTIENIYNRVKQYLDKYNLDNPTKKMNLYLFDDALRHVLRISRVLSMNRGNMMLVGVGGSGKKSLTTLASILSRNIFFQLSISKSYTLLSFQDDLRYLYKTAGQLGKGITFLFNDSDIKEESFLDSLNSILTSGEVFNLFPKEELQLMLSDLRSEALRTKKDFLDTSCNLTNYFIEKVKDNLHLVLCFSPVNSQFSERCMRYPGLVNSCTIDWFFPWPLDALTSVSKGFLNDFPMDCTNLVKEQLISHMALVHDIVVDICLKYYTKMRRFIYQTPKSFLTFLTTFKTLYTTKLLEVNKKESCIHMGLQKLIQGAEDVEKMKITLKEEEKKLKIAENATNIMLRNLEIKSMEAKKENDIVRKIKEQCEKDTILISKEKDNAEEDLAKAKPYLEEAEEAVSSIKPNDLNELKKLAKPGDIIKLIFDCVSILKMNSLIKVETSSITLGIGKEKTTIEFILDSFQLVKSGMLSDARFLQSIFHFSKYEKDQINAETVEFMIPYLNLEGFTPAVARNASRAAEGLCSWVKSMISYYEASKVVKPKLEALRLAEGRMEAAHKELYLAEEKLQKCQQTLNKLQEDFENQMAEKARIEENTHFTRKKMEQATALINGLAGERQRWTEDSLKFADLKKRLVGDCAKVSAFLSYCGPFNKDFRDHLLNEKFTKDLILKDIPVTNGLELTCFLIDIGIIADWNIQGLPTDSLSIQNGLLVSKSSRYPLLIDPQGQALYWIQHREIENLPNFGLTYPTNPKLKDQLESSLAEGKTLILTCIEQQLDSMFNSILDKQIIYKAKSKYIKVSDKLCEFNSSFTLYLITRLSNPHFSPELQANTTIIDFTVTQKGLEEQLLGKVIQKEQKLLEEQLIKVQYEVTSKTKALLQLDALLLERLSASADNLLDDNELISVLADTKSKVIDVNQKLLAAAEMKLGINEKREQYRHVATRGSVLYCCIVEMSLVNSMYQTSLDQFLLIFMKSMDLAEKGINLISKRVNNIIDTLTYLVYRYINRGLYEKDKLSFLFIITLKIIISSEELDETDLTLFLKAGAALDINIVKKKPFLWMSNQSYLNLIQLSTEKPTIFKTILFDIERNEINWKKFYEENEPEKQKIPDYEQIFLDLKLNGNFYRLLLIRCLREDRVILAINDFIRKSDFIEIKTIKLSLMGSKYIEPITDTIETIFNEMTNEIPVLYLLSSGADPTDSIELLAKKRKEIIQSISMGEGQEIVATKAINLAMINGSWILLQNCHLGLQYMENLEEILYKFKDNCSLQFRLFLTTEPHENFSILLLQKCIRVTNEPPLGLRAGMLRSYTSVIDQDKLDRIDTKEWRILLYSLCFLHSIVQERRKFSSLGWNIPYEFNTSDLTACILFLEKHLYSGNICWSTLQYMIAEVQYGGRITDTLDRRLFLTYCEVWIGISTLNSNFTFNSEHSSSSSSTVTSSSSSSSSNKSSSSSSSSSSVDFLYNIPEISEITEYQKYISTFPQIDSPEILGLHLNADLTYRVKEVQVLFNTILDTQPKQTASKNGRRSEDIVLEKTEELLKRLPEFLNEEDSLEKITKLGGLHLPLNIFLYQEIQRLQYILNLVKDMLTIVQLAIRGEVIMTLDILDTVNALYDAKVPKRWILTIGGDEISWFSSTLGLWFTGLIDRVNQLKTWLEKGRPTSFWLKGFFNPIGFLTSMQQEVTRSHFNDKWTLDEIVLHTEVTEYEKQEHIKQAPKEGVFLHGLYLEGASWNKNEGTLIESEPKKLFSIIPILYVTAVTKLQKKNRSVDYGPYGGYECPCYKYPCRTDRYLVFNVILASREHRPMHWILRGVALLCSTD